MAGVVSPGNVVTTGEVTVDGIRSPLLQAGPPRAREAVVFVHGNPGCSHDWEDLLGRIGEFGRAVARCKSSPRYWERPRERGLSHT